MVSTRQHPRDFSSTATAAKDLSKPSQNDGGPVRKWVHTPSTAVTLWLALSIPFVLWDSSYVLLRPHSMPGNRLHSPIWTPYALYGTIDYIYGWPAFNESNGFTAAQTIMNLVETAAYLYYLGVIYAYGTPIAPSTGRPQQRKTGKGALWLFKDDKVVSGRTGAVALLVAFSASIMTVSKTALYCELSRVPTVCRGMLFTDRSGLNEACSGFANIGHNDVFTLVFLWILPK